MSEEFRRGRSGGTESTRQRSESTSGGRGDAQGRARGAKEAIRSYRDLRVYEGAMEAAMQVFELTKGFPAEERLAMVSQIRRASRAVCTNIGAAWRRRRSQAHFVDKLSDSESEAEETRVWVDIASRYKYFTPEQVNELGERYDRICAQLGKMILEAERWLIREKGS
jgi:four helix bundle protein